MASRGVNKVILLGNLGQDPEVRYTASGSAVTNIRIATSEQWTDKQSGQKQERTEWHTIVFFGRLAEIAGEYLKKGRQCYVEGALRTRKWQGKDGQDRYTTEVVASELQLLGGGGGGSASYDGGGSGGGQSRGGGQYGGGGGGAPQQGRPAPPPPQGGSSFDDDDIPF